MRSLIIGLMVAGLTGCITPHQEQNGLWTKLAKPEERSGLGTNQSFARLERCKGPAEKKPWYKFYFESDFSDCFYLTKEDQDEWQHASSRGAGPEIISAFIWGASLGTGAALSGGTSAAVATSSSVASSVTKPVLNIRGHYGR